MHLLISLAQKTLSLIWNQ